MTLTLSVLSATLLKTVNWVPWQPSGLGQMVPGKITEVSYYTTYYGGNIPETGTL